MINSFIKQFTSKKFDITKINNEFFLVPSELKKNRNEHSSHTPAELNLAHPKSDGGAVLSGDSTQVPSTKSNPPKQAVHSPTELNSRQRSETMTHFP